MKGKETKKTRAGLAYETFGGGERVIVALPGIGDTRASYRRLAPMLADAGFCVHVMDLRGHGGSDVGFSSYTSEDIGDDVVDFLDQADLSDATLVGNSIGAAAIVHASLRSDRAARLVSLSGFLGDPPNFKLLRPMLALAFSPPWGRSLWRRYRASLFATPPPDLAQDQDAVFANLGEPGRLTAMRAMMRASKAGIADRLYEVSLPTLVAMGAGDPDFTEPAAEARRQADALGGDNRIVMIEGAGHYPQIEKPEDTARAIITFIEETPGHGA